MTFKSLLGYLHNAAVVMKPGQSFTYSLIQGNEAIYQSIPIILCVLTSSEKLKFSGGTHSCQGGMTWGSTYIQGLSFLSPQMHQLANQ